MFGVVGRHTNQLDGVMENFASFRDHVTPPTSLANFSKFLLVASATNKLSCRPGC